MHRRVQVQPSERTRVGIGEQCATDLVGQFWTQLSFTLSPCNGGKHLGDRKLREHQTQSAAQKRIESLALGFRHVELRQRAGIDVYRGLDARGSRPGGFSFARLCIENGGRERLVQLWHPASKCRTATERLRVCGTGRHQSRDGLASIRNCDFVPLSNLSNQCRQVLPGFTYSCFFHPAIVLRSEERR